MTTQRKRFLLPILALLIVLLGLALRPDSAEAGKCQATYTIKKGDTLSGVAKNYGLKLQTLLDANGLKSTSLIKPGDKLCIPPKPLPSTSTTKPGTSKPTGTTTAPKKGVPSKCSRSSKSTKLVICIDNRLQTSYLRDGAGNVLLDLGTVTTSREIRGSGDYLTPTGNWLVQCMDPLSGDGEDECNPVSSGLKWLIQWPTSAGYNTSTHGYKKARIGPGEDSNGCERVNPDLADDLFAFVLAVFEVGGRIEVSVYESPV